MVKRLSTYTISYIVYLLFMLGGFLCIPAFLNSQSNSYSIENISKQFGTGSQEINAICEDEYGFMWVGTMNGIVKYDGQNAYSYTQVQKDSSEFLLENAYSLFPYNKDNLLIGSLLHGLVRYEYATDRLIYVPLDVEPDVHIRSALDDFEVDEYGNIWISYYKGIIVLDKDFNVIKRFRGEEIVTDNKLEGIFDIEISKAGDVYCNARWNGVYRLKAGTEKFERIFPHNLSAYKDERYYRLRETPAGNILVGTLLSNVLELTPEGNIISQYTIKPTKTIPPKIEVWGLEVNDSVVYMGGINAGLYSAPLGEPDKVKEVTLSIEPGNKNAVSVSGIIHDHYGNIWVANHRPGLFKINNNTAFSSSFAGEPHEWVLGKYVNCMYEIDSVLWAGTDGEGLYYYDFKNNSSGQLTMDGGLSSNVIMDIEPDSDGKLWLATWSGGLSVVDPKTLEIDTYKYTPGAGVNSVSFPNIKGISFVRDTLWIATHGDGINFYVPETGLFTSHMSASEGISNELNLANWGNNAYLDSKGVIWFGTKMGLFEYKNGRFINYLPVHENDNSLYDREVSDIYESTDGKLWIGSKTGLQYFAADRSKIIRIPHAVIPFGVGSIIEGDDNELYLGTQDGLYHFNYQTLHVKKYTQDDGLIADIFRDRSVFKSADGTIYWGTTEGISFLPSDKNALKEYSPTVFVNSFEVMNEYDSVQSQLFNVFADTALELSYNHARIDIATGVLGIPDIHNAQLSHKLVGIDKVFLENTSSIISYSKIPSGDYSLIIKTDYCGNIYNRKIYIAVLPPFWQTWWFYVLESLIAILIVYGIYRLRVRQLQAQKQKLTLQVEEKTKQLIIQNNQLSEKSEELAHANEELSNANEEIADAYSELKGQSEELEATNQLLEKTNRTQQELVSVLAHDVKNSFGAVKGFANLIRQNPMNWKRYIPFVENGVDVSTLLLNNLLLWFRSQTDDIKLNFETLTLNEIISECIEQNIANAEIKAIRVIYPQVDLPSVHIDKNTFMLAVRNLLHNAVKFSHTDSEVVIDVQTLSYKNEVEITIRDFGKGMSEQKQQRFNNADQLYSMEGTAGEQGTGLGLMLVRKYVEMNNAEIKLESVENSGSSFTITLPCIISSDRKKVENSPSQNIADPVTAHINQQFLDYTILLVEDNLSFRTQTAKALEAYFNVIEATNGEDALNILSKEKPDIIITDYMMPKMKGDELARTVKDNSDTAHIPVVMFSAVDEDEYSLKALESGIDSYISKSENPQKLILKITNIIKTRVHFEDRLNVKSNTPANLQNKESLEFMDKVNLILQKEYSNPLFGVEQLADYVGMDRSHLYRRVKAACSKTPVELLINFRLEKAMALLQSKQYSVSDVAYLCGFNASTYFSTKFKKKFNKTPTEILSSKN